MKKIHYILLCLVCMLAMSCTHNSNIYHDAEYVMFADTVAVYPVQKDVEYFKVPVVSTVKCSYDRTFGVEVIDAMSNATENLHYRLKSNTITIPAGENRADVLVQGLYENLDPADSLGFCLSLVMPDDLEMPGIGRLGKVVLRKACPLDINDFTGWCVLSSTWLQSYNPYGSYNRLIRTSAHPEKPNTIICHNWMLRGYDVEIELNNDENDVLNTLVSVPEGQSMSDEGSFFGMAHGDDRIRIKTSSRYNSYYYPCGKYLFVWTEMYVKDLNAIVGTVGHFYNVMEWISTEEARRLKREGMAGDDDNELDPYHDSNDNK